MNIFDIICKEYSGRSIVLISHRLANITLCDNILVLEGGRIIEEGSHKELLAKKGRYHYLFNLQANKYLSETHQEDPDPSPVKG